MSARWPTHPAGEGALVVALGEGIDPAVHAQVAALDRALALQPAPGMIETIPSYTSVMIVFDPLVSTHADVRAHVAQLDAAPVESRAPVTHVVSVCYDGAFAPDIEVAAETLGSSTEAIIAQHLATTYRCYMYGFAPGYAYLGGGPPELVLPRKTSAVRGVPAGAVMLFGEQCIVTTLELPSGWWVIGRSPTRIFDAARARPFLFEPGDLVRFERVSAAALEGL